MKNSPNEETHVRENTVAQLMIHFWHHQARSSKVVLDSQVLSSRYQPAFVFLYRVTELSTEAREGQELLSGEVEIHELRCHSYAFPCLFCLRTTHIFHMGGIRIHLPS